jgi:hypothetical protein
MRQLARRFLLILCTLALVSGSTISFAASVAAAPCLHEHSHQTGTPAHHDLHGAGCLSCCLGACTAIPDLPPRFTISAAAFTATPVNYWETDDSLSGRSIAPDLGPPRTTA